MNHRKKLKLARRISGLMSGAFYTPEWFKLKQKIENRVNKTIYNQKLASRLRREKLLKGGEN